MLSQDYFYYKLMRKYVILFGTVFNQITLIRKAPDSDTELERFRVPISYAPKDKYVTRFESDPDLLKSTQTVLPRMSFYITNVSYDADRKQGSLLKVAKNETEYRTAKQYMGVPYDIEFELAIYAKTTDDGLHILEQILPYFNPDYTIPITPIPTMEYIKDVPIILNSVESNTTYEGDWDSVRYVIWTLKFTVKGYFWGPITTPKIIRKSIANIFNDPSLVTGYVIRINTDAGNNGTFIIRDTVFQGNTYSQATAFATVLTWDKSNQKLMIGGAQGQFKVNNTIRGISSNAVYTIESFDASPLKLVQITVEPDPIDAEPTDDFGYTETIVEFPETIE